MESWGKHLIIDAENGNISKITDKDHIAKFVDNLIEKIDMVKYGPLWIERFATHDVNKAGISFVQMIETSNVTGHFVEKNGDFYLDIFSCKEFDPIIVLELVDDYFQPENMVYEEILRGEGRTS